MSEEKLELLRPLLAEWANGNFWAAPELLAPDVTFRAAMPANFVANGLEEVALRVLEVLDQWSDYRIEAEELEDVGEDDVLAVGRQRGTGKLSGADADYPIFILFEFRGDKVIGVYFEGTREAALEAAGLRE
jgi:ketosteroid isomerase-like protein